MKAARFEVVIPADAQQAIAALGSDGARPLAGGQSLGPMLNLRLVRPALLVDIGRLPALRAVEDRAGEGVLFGAAITHAEIEDGRVPDPTRGVMPAVARNIAYRAVRNRGTIGGSLAHADPAADWPTTLAALGATVRIAGRGAERHVPVEDFIVGAFETVLAPQEIVTGVLVPHLSRTARWGFWKACRKVGEFAEAMVAALSDPDRGVARIVIGATEGRMIMVANAADAMLRPETLDATMLEAGLGADPADLALRRTAIRRAIAAVRAWPARTTTAPG